MLENQSSCQTSRGGLSQGICGMCCKEKALKVAFLSLALGF
uniref:Uncharacterized protein n=1 Tax=Rhizophora mucronata TaxID=61149 RepID=A0A2P2Q2Z1_RHIMU